MFDLPLIKGLANQFGGRSLDLLPYLMVMRSKYELHLIEGLVMQSGGESS